MAKRRKARDRKKQKKRDRRRRLDTVQKRNSTPLAREVTPKLADKLDRVYDLIDVRRFAEAEQLLERLAKRYDKYPAVVEAQLCLYQTTRDHERCCQAARRLLKLTPRDPDARLIYAQESMFCARLGIALANYRFFLKHWPDHTNVQQARKAIEVIEPECENSIRSMGFGDAGLEALVLHDEGLECVQNGRFKEAADKFSQLLTQAPDCISARNNLALASFQCGEIDQAIHVAEETCRLASENRFAEAVLGKLRFLTGKEDAANAIADRIVVHPPTEQASLAAAIELLSFLGRGEGVVMLSESAQERGIPDPRCQAVVLHHFAVAKCRLGDEQAARSSWKKCLKAMPSHAEARENLDDLDSGRGHAPWPESLGKWIPRNVFDVIVNRMSAIDRTQHINLTRIYPPFATLVPALLDRGDPLGRKMAMQVAVADGSPATMLDALHEFAFSSHGPDAMRLEAMSILSQRGRVDSGHYRFYHHGKWINIKPFTAEIDWEPSRCSTPSVQKLVETGTEAMNQGDFALAEESFQRILQKEPNNYCAAYNLCLVWLERDGRAGRRRARARMVEIYEQFPDYVFAPIALAQFAAMDGDLDRAGELLEPILDAKKLHASEAIALFAAQVQIAIKRREFDLAEQSLVLLVQLAGEDDPKVVKLRHLIDTASRGRGLRRLLPFR